MSNQQSVTETVSFLHRFSQDVGERRQYARVALEFPLWWLKDFKGNEPVPGIGIEISGGGLQFLLQHTIDHQCSLAFELNGRAIRANSLIVQSADFEFRGQMWKRYRAKFVGIMDTDFDFIMAFTKSRTKEPVVAAPAPGPAQRTARVPEKPKRSFGVLESYDMLPLRVQEKIVLKLVQLKRMASPAEIRLASLAAHYGGTQAAQDGRIYHRFFIRTRMHLQTGASVFNTEILISDDGNEVLVRD